MSDLGYYDSKRQDLDSEHYECIVEDGVRYFGHGMICRRPELHDERVAIALVLESHQNSYEQADTQGFEGYADAILHSDWLARHDAQVRAEAIRNALGQGVIMAGDRGVNVWEDRNHYERGTPDPLPIREWLAKRGEMIKRAGARTVSVSKEMWDDLNLEGGEA